MAVWREINNTDGRYEISERGELRAVKTKKIIKLHPNRDGYFQYTAYTDGGRRPVLMIHRVVAEHFLTDWDNNLTVNHKDSNKQNNHINNLEMITVSENNKHRNRNNKYMYRSSKLPKQEVLKVLKDSNRTLNNQQWANLLGVSRFVIRDIRRGKTYKKLAISHD